MTNIEKRFFQKRQSKTFGEKKIYISFRHLIYLNLIDFLEFLGIRNIIKKIFSSDRKTI